MVQIIPIRMGLLVGVCHLYQKIGGKCRRFVVVGASFQDIVVHNWVVV